MTKQKQIVDYSDSHHASRDYHSSDNSNSFDIWEIITDLQGLFINLRQEVSELPRSIIRQYLLFEITKPIELKSKDDFYSLRDRVYRMMDIGVQANLNKNILKLLEEMSAMLKKIVFYVESEIRF